MRRICREGSRAFYIVREKDAAALSFASILQHGLFVRRSYKFFARFLGERLNGITEELKEPFHGEKFILMTTF